MNIKSRIPTPVKKFLKAVYIPVILIKSFVKQISIKRKSGWKVNVGCGNERLVGFVNADIRPTFACDIVTDLTHLDLFRKNVSLFFSNAVLEHIAYYQRIEHLKSAYEGLQDSGSICYIGIPNFPIVARAYLERQSGTVGPVFDLYNVYRYTHGAPEETNYPYHQFHKSLFDSEEICSLLSKSGYKFFVIFQYASPTDYSPQPVNLGFYASKNSATHEELQKSCIELLGQLKDKVSMKTLEFII